MAALDWIAIAVLTVSLLLGVLRGLVFELVSLAGWVVAFIAAQWFAEDVGVWLPFGEPSAPWRYVAGFLLVFVISAFLAGLLATLMRKLVAATGLRPVDRTLGACFGIARGVLALLALAVVVNVMAWRQSALWQEARTAEILDAAMQGLKPALPAKLASYLP